VRAEEFKEKTPKESARQERNCIGTALEDTKRVIGVKAQRESQATRFNEKNSRGGVTDT